MKTLYVMPSSKTPASVDHAPLVGEGAKNGVYYALDRATMKPVWTTAAGTQAPTGGYLGSTVFDGT